MTIARLVSERKLLGKKKKTLINHGEGANFGDRRNNKTHYHPSEVLPSLLTFIKDLRNTL